MTLVSIESAAATLGISEPWRLRDLAVLGGSPKAYGPMQVAGSDFRVMVDSADIRAWDLAGRPIADDRYRASALADAPRQSLWSRIAAFVRRVAG